MRFCDRCGGESPLTKNPSVYTCQLCLKDPEGRKALQQAYDAQSKARFLDLCLEGK